jgi:hypothetical protein
MPEVDEELRAAVRAFLAAVERERRALSPYPLQKLAELERALEGEDG